MINKRLQNLRQKLKLSYFARIGIRDDMENFIENLMMLLVSGLDLAVAIEALKEESSLSRIQNWIEKIEDYISEGGMLWEILNSAKLLPPYAISLIRIGEESGNLDANLKIVIQQLQKDRQFRSKLYSIMMYPVFILILSIIIGLGIAWFILPKLTMVFDRLKIKLPFVTQMMLDLGIFMKDYGIIVIPASVFILFLLLFFIFLFPKTKFLGHMIFFHTPGIKKLIQEIEIARMGYILGTLLKAGMPIVSVMKSLYNVSHFYYYQKLYIFLKNQIEDGFSFQESFLLYPKIKKVVPVPIQKMINAGEQSGFLPETMLKIGKAYEEKTESTMKYLTIIIEPIMLIIIWLGVSFLAISIILPIYGIIGGLSGG